MHTSAHAVNRIVSYLRCGQAHARVMCAAFGVACLQRIRQGSGTSPATRLLTHAVVHPPPPSPPFLMTDTTNARLVNLFLNIIDICIGGLFCVAGVLRFFGFYTVESTVVGLFLLSDTYTDTYTHTHTKHTHKAHTHTHTHTHTPIQSTHTCSCAWWDSYTYNMQTHRHSTHDAMTRQLGCSDCQAHCTYRNIQQMHRDTHAQSTRKAHIDTYTYT